MRVLAIDAGNSRIKWGVAEVSAGGASWLRRGWLDTADAALTGKAWRELPAPDCIAIANVAGDDVRDALLRTLERYGVAPLWVRGCDEQCGVKSGYADPAQLGADRWAGLIAAWRLYGSEGSEGSTGSGGDTGNAGRACVVVNAGTTITVDALSHEGVFLGGVIVPGIDLMRASLERGTAQLKRQPGAFAYFPDNTADAIMSGALNAAAGAIDRMRDYMAQGGEGEALIVLSGGAAALIEPRLNAKVVLVDNLVLEGVLAIARDAHEAMNATHLNPGGTVK
jgi:type III pantothenate kinase